MRINNESFIVLSLAVYFHTFSFAQVSTSCLLLILKVYIMFIACF